MFLLYFYFDSLLHIIYIITKIILKYAFTFGPSQYIQFANTIKKDNKTVKVSQFNTNVKSNKLLHNKIIFN